MGFANLLNGAQLEFNDASGEFLPDTDPELIAQYWKEQEENQADHEAEAMVETVIAGLDDGLGLDIGTGPLLPPVKGRKELIMIFGESGTGKTHGLLSIANEIFLSGSPAHFYGIDTDWAMELNLDNFPDLAASGRMHIYPAPTYGEVDAATDQILKQIKKDREDWIFVDRASDVWIDAPAHYVKSRIGKDLDDLEKAYRASGKEGKAGFKQGSALLEYYASGISPMYRAWEQSIIYRSGAHVVFVCTETQVVTGTGRMDDSNATQREFGKLKPGGNKETPFKFHSRLHFMQKHDRKWTCTTKRERGARDWWNAKPVSNFGQQYLLNVAKWRRDGVQK